MSFRRGGSPVAPDAASALLDARRRARRLAGKRGADLNRGPRAITDRSKSEVGAPNGKGGDDAVERVVPGPRSLVLWTVWFALVAGLLDSLYIALSPTPDVASLGPDALWASPLLNLVWVGIPGFTLALFAHRVPGRLDTQTSLAVVATFAWFAIAVAPHGIHPAVAIILAVGLGMQTGRFLAGRASGFDRLCRRSTGWLALPVVVAAFVVVGNGWWSERSDLASLAPAPAGRPNVLVLLIDTGAASHFSLYGYERRTTPRLTALAEGGVVFEHAIAPSSFTLPSHAAFFTGRYPNSLLPSRQAPLDDTYPTLAEALARAGYVTAAFTANVAYLHPRFGLDRGFIHYDVYPRSFEELLLSHPVVRLFSVDRTLRRWSGYRELLGRRRAEQINDAFSSWLSSHADRPFFAFLNYFDAHEPYLPPDRFHKLFDRGHPRRLDMMEREHRTVWVKFNRPVARDGFLGELDAYDASIAYVDEQIGRLLDELRRTGILDRTVVIITSDHGEAFVEHGHHGHGRSLYEPELHVPLLIIYPPEVPADLRVDRSVSLQDLPVTVLDLLGLENQSGFPGRPLSRFWTVEADDAPPDLPLLAQLWLYHGEGVAEALTLDRMKYVRTQEWTYLEEELFDLQNDPGERHSLIGTARGDSLVPRFRALLDSTNNGR